jgi:protein-L-isoaspartate(D-aspartate) O-methyltransferase
MSTCSIVFLLAGLLALACKQAAPARPPYDGGSRLPAADPLSAAQASGGSAASERSDERFYMVRWQLESRDVKDAAVLEAMRKVPRHRFVTPDWQDQAYDDHPLPIGYDQTISQPYIVGFMTQAISPKADMKVLEIGTGSGYQAAVLAELVREVYTIEIVEPLGRRAEAALAALGYRNVHVRVGDGFDGWAEHAPYDAIVVTAAPTAIPQPLLDQLKVGGVLVAPIGQHDQQLRVYTKAREGVSDRFLLDVRFVPMTGKAQDRNTQEAPEVEAR